MSDFGSFDDYGWTSMPTGIDDSGIENVYVTPQVDLGTPSFDGSTSSAWNIDDFGKALQYGVKAYGQIEAINHGGYGGYPPASPQPSPEQQVGLPAPTQPQPQQPGFDWSKLKDFSTPYPYAVGLAGLVLFTVIFHATMPRER